MPDRQVQKKSRSRGPDQEEIKSFQKKVEDIATEEKRGFFYLGTVEDEGKPTENTAGSLLVNGVSPEELLRNLVTALGLNSLEVLAILMNPAREGDEIINVPEDEEFE